MTTKLTIAAGLGDAVMPTFGRRIQKRDDKATIRQANAVAVLDHEPG